MSIKTRKIFAAFVAVLCAFAAFAAAMGVASAKAEEAEDGYVPVYELAGSDDFEGLKPVEEGKSQYIWDNTAMFYAENETASVTTAAGEVLAGGASLKWFPGHDNEEGWTESSKVLGLSDKKVTGLEGGYMLRLEFKLKMSGVEQLVVKNCAVADGSTLQEMVIGGDYERISDSATIDKDEETVCSVEKTDYGAEVSFAVRGDVSKIMYYAFYAKTESAESYVILDDVKLYKESRPVLEYRAYEDFFAENFENSSVEGGQLKGSAFSLQNGADTGRTAIVSDNAIAGENSLKVYLGARNSKIAALRTGTIEGLSDDWFKLYYRFKADRVSEIYVYVRNAADDSILYDSCYNLNSGARIIEETNILFDSSSFDHNAAGVYTAYGEFSVPAGTQAYAEVCFKTENANGYLILDDFNVLRAYERGSILDYRQPVNEAVKPSGRLEAEAGEVNVGENEAKAYVGFIGTGGDDGKAALIVATYAVILLAAAAALAFGRKKNRKPLTAVLAGVIFMSIGMNAVGCNKKETYMPAGQTVVTPEKISGKLDNPGMGWVVLEEPTYGGHADNGASGVLPEVDNVSVDSSWAHIEVEEDKYDFSYLDQTIDYWTSRGKRVNLRVCTDTLMLTYTYKGVPDYLFEKYNVAYEEHDYSDGGAKPTYIVPDITDKNYLARLEKFLAVIAEHYAGNKMVDTVEIRAYGVWGEWHSGYQYADKDERMSALQNIIDKYYDAYAATGKTLALCAAWDPSYTTTGEYEMYGDNAYLNYVNWSAFDYLWRLDGATFRRDSGGGLLYYRYDEKLLAEAFRSGKRVPLLGEYGTNFAALSSEANGFDLMDGINDILYKMRANYSTVLGWVSVELASIIEQGYTEFIDRGNEMFGYRLSVDRAFYPSSAAPGGEITLMTEWTNSAVGRFCYKSPLTVYLLDGSGKTAYSYTDTEFDARTFVQGEVTDIYTAFTLPQDLAAGTYKLAVAITDENGEPYIELGQAGQIGDSRIYELGEIDVKPGAKTKTAVTKTNYASADEFKFDKNSTYRITFKYLPHFDMKNFYFDQNDGYEFSLVSAKGGSVGTYRWQDISGEAGWKTVTVHTGNYNDYKMRVISDNFDRITVGDVYIEKLTSSCAEDFEDYDFTDTSTVLEPINTVTASLYTGGSSNSYGEAVSPISGGSSVRLYARQEKGFNVLAKVDVNNYEFKKDTLYSVTFDFAALDAVAKGGYYFVGTGKYDEVKNMNSPVDVVGEWYERDDNYVTKKTFVFLNEEEGNTLVFGVKNGGSYLIDNLVVAELGTKEIVRGQDLANEHNVIPTFTHGIGITETFEEGSFAASGFNWGQFAWGRMTIDPDEVVNYGEDNKCSLLGRVEEEVQNPETDTVWFEFARTNTKYYKFEAGKTYKVEFEYKILKAYPQGKIFCFFRDDSVANRFETVVGDNSDLSSQKPVGEVIKFSQEFTLGDYDGYQFMISMNYAWEVAIDNILITEVV